MAFAASVIWTAWRRRSAPESKLEAVSFLVLWCFTLGLALRFGGRTYPGIYFPDSTVMNSLFNGVGLFEQVGYDAVAICFVSRLAIIVLPLGNGANACMRVISWLAILLAVLIVIYGFYWAWVLERLP
jgi:hypothetical protein